MNSRWGIVDLNRVWKLLGLLWRCMAEICCKLLVALQLVFRVLPLLSSPCYLLLSNICADFQIVLLWQLGRHSASAGNKALLWLLIMMRRGTGELLVLGRGDRGALKPWLYFAMPPHQDKRAFSMENFLTLKIVWWKSFYHRVRIGCQQGSCWFFASIFLRFLPVLHATMHCVTNTMQCFKKF